MSWCIHPPIQAEKPAAARELLAQQNLPPPIREYIAQGIDGLVQKRGDDVAITVTGHGHLCEGMSYEVSNAVIEVKPAQ